MTAPAAWPTTPYICWFRTPIAGITPGDAYSQLFSGWLITTPTMLFISNPGTGNFTSANLNPQTAALSLSRIDDLDGTPASLQARIESDFLAAANGTYTRIGYLDPALPDTGSYPYLDPAWIPEWITQLPSDLTADQITFVWD